MKKFLLAKFARSERSGLAQRIVCAEEQRIYTVRGRFEENRWTGLYFCDILIKQIEDRGAYKC